MDRNNHISKLGPLSNFVSKPGDEKLAFRSYFDKLSAPSLKMVIFTHPGKKKSFNFSDWQLRKKRLILSILLWWCEMFHVYLRVISLWDRCCGFPCLRRDIALAFTLASPGERRWKGQLSSSSCCSRILTGPKTGRSLTTPKWPLCTGP